MIEGEVVREVRAAREAFAASHGYDIRAMVAALREMDLASGWEVVRLPPRPVQWPNQTPPPTGTAKLVSGPSSPPVADPVAER